MIFLDTNVLIEILKNNSKALTKISALGADLSVTAITAMELLYGARNKQELKKLQQFLVMFEVVHIDVATSKKAIDLVTLFAKSHALDIPDAIIAASCLQNDAALFTYNVKDFRFIPNIKLVD